MISNFLSKLGNNTFTWDIGLAVLFFLFMGNLLLKNKKKVSLEKIFFPVLYAFLYRDKFGIKKLENFVKKRREAIKLYGYISIGVGFIGMFFAVLLLLYTAYQVVFQPKAASVAPFLPFVEVPVLGYISFSHWIITIFILVIFHEAAHAIVALAHDVKIKNTGFGLFAIFIPCIPAAFVEPDEKQLKKKSDVVQYSMFAAGPMANFLLIIPILLFALLFIGPVEGLITETSGFTFDIIANETYPAYSAGIKNQTLFNMHNGVEVLTIEKFYEEISFSRPGDIQTIGYFNKTTNTLDYEYTITEIENPNDNKKGFLGIINLQNNLEIKEKYKILAPPFSWLKGLTNLLLVITFSLGLINLFPASLTDGGQMFSLAMSKVSKNKKFNQLIISTLALFFLILIMFSLITYFTGNPFILING